MNATVNVEELPRPGSRWSVGVNEKIEAIGPEFVEFKALKNAFDKIHLAVELEMLFLRPINDRPVVERAEADRAFRLWHQRRVNVARDRRVEHTPAVRDRRTARRRFLLRQSSNEAASGRAPS